MEATKKFYERQAKKTIIQNLQRRNMVGYYCPNKEEANELILSLISKDSTVTFGGSMTLKEIGILDNIAKGPYNLLDRARQILVKKSKKSTPKLSLQIHI